MIDSSQLSRVMTALGPLLDPAPLSPPKPAPEPKPQAAPPEFVTVYEAADRLHVDRQAIYGLCQSSTLPHTRVGGAYWVRPGDVEAYLAVAATS